MESEKEVTLIIGGSSGLGLELAKRITARGFPVICTGTRKQAAIPHGARYHQLELHDIRRVPERIDRILARYAHVHHLIYAAGFEQQLPIDELDWGRLTEMAAVGILAPEYLMHRLLKRKRQLEGFIAITSTSQWVPRANEPAYAAAKAALGHFAASVALDSRMKKTLVVGVAGMRTDFWRNQPDKNTSAMLDPAWVADRICEHYDEQFTYRFIKVLSGNAQQGIVHRLVVAESR